MNKISKILFFINLVYCFGLFAIPEKIINCDIGQKEAVPERWQLACTAMSVAAAAYLFHEPLGQIESQDLFSIIWLGGNFYDAFNSPEKELAADPHLFESFNRYLNVIEQSDYQIIGEELGVGDSISFFGVNAQDKDELDRICCRLIQDGKPTHKMGGLLTGQLIEHLFNSHRELKCPIAVVFTLDTAYSYAIIVQNDHFLFFDSHHKTGDHTGSRLLIFNTVEEMNDFLLVELPHVPFSGSFIIPRSSFIKRSVISTEVEKAYEDALMRLGDDGFSFISEEEKKEQIKALQKLAEEEACKKRKEQEELDAETACLVQETEDR
ncbi:TPA: hypothetical protein DIC20_03250 [Candidatus Dependentiae bacterium]|nr:MAG: hypothetical protein US03_C0001G0039 [candidate division TM6 bacterium GW2011_GWF2_36_131]KKQ03825.1 MAG: hypothetical protein US13_C0001G0165 [candidate division TM6 bacterium GW2011_GWE2_36_25]KKQ19971.1 MAG: hypothetical protein US32_C0003G0088 [candidate division TM6 bacterium GW2011_GWA2_36_9]HBR70593.1 hypothetical protein [Candidatus Dependentiae bacterium]HCU00692.1 hypothetical protein [Candidatus Dependentiae bacterium]